MDDPREQGTLTEAKASRLLERAAKLDAEGGPRVRVAELREVALEAGISGEAFDLALAEISGPETSGSAVATQGAVPGPAGKGARSSSLLSKVLHRTGLFVGGSVLAFLSQTLISDVGMDSEPVMIFTLVVAALVVMWSAVTKRRDRDVLEFEVDLGVLWTAMTFWLMLTNPGDVADVLEVMMPAGFLASILGGFAVATGPGEPAPEQLPEKV